MNHEALERMESVESKFSQLQVDFEKKYSKISAVKMTEIGLTTQM